KAGHDRRMAGQLVEQERDSRGRRVVAREQESHYLVAHLQIAQRIAVLVVGVEQQAEDVLAALAARAAVRDLRIDELVELARRCLQPRPWRERAAEDTQQILARV